MNCKLKQQINLCICELQNDKLYIQSILNDDGITLNKKYITHEMLSYMYSNVDEQLQNDVEYYDCMANARIKFVENIALLIDVKYDIIDIEIFQIFETVWEIQLNDNKFFNLIDTYIK